MTIQENALSDVRVEWVEETTEGEAPSNPEWNKFSDYIEDAPGWDGSPDISENNALGSGDTVEITEGAEEHGFTIQYWLQRAPVDGSDNVQDPIAYPFEYDFASELSTNTIVFRRDVESGGNDDAGFRQYTVGIGQKPVSATIPGDPGESSPQSLELEYVGEYGRSHVIHQPSSSTTLDVTNNGSTSVDVTIENEGAGASETVTVSGNSTVTTTASFADIDVIWVASGEPDGTIDVTDGSGTTILEDGLSGTDTLETDYERGIPPLGSGSHASDIGNDPEQFIGLNTNVDRGGSVLADRVHGFDLTAELENSQEPALGSKFSPVDEGVRTVTIECDVAGPYQSTKELKELFDGTESDIIATIGGTSSTNGSADITLDNAQITDTDEQSYGAGDENFIFGVTFAAQQDTGSAVDITNTT